MERDSRYRRPRVSPTEEMGFHACKYFLRPRNAWTIRYLADSIPSSLSPELFPHRRWSYRGDDFRQVDFVSDELGSS